MATIEENINRLKSAKANIKSAIISKGVAVDDSLTLDAYAEKISSIVVNKYTGDTISVRDYRIKFAYSTFYEVPDWADFKGVTDMSEMFYGCSSLTTIPQIDTSSVTNMHAMLVNCSSLTTIQLIDTSRVTNMRSMLANCSSLTTIPQIDTSSVTSMALMLSNCSSLTTIPQIDTSSVTDMESMFSGCKGLTTIPQIDTSNVTSMEFMFRGCSSLTTIPQIDTSSVTNMYGMFTGCTSLTTIPQINTSTVENMDYIFRYCTSLTDLGGFIGLKCNLDLSSCRAITHDSIMNVINNAADVTGNDIRLKLGSANLAKITDEEKAVATNKGWTLA